MAQIFISYSREDEERIQPLVLALENEGWSVFWDRRIPAGQTWRDYIGKALDDAGCVIVVWSCHSIISNWVCDEADEAKRRGVLLPILLDAVEPPMGFRSFQASDLTDWSLGASVGRKHVDCSLALNLGRIPARWRRVEHDHAPDET